MGVLAALRGLVVGRPFRYTSEQKAELREVLLERTARYDFPIVTDVDFGHTDAALTLQVGVRAVIDVSRQILSIVEPAVAAG